MHFNKIRNNFRYILGLPKSIYVNFTLLDIKDAIKLPIIVSSKTKLSSLRGKVKLDKIKTGIVRIGFGNVKMLDFTYNRTILHLDGSIWFKGKCKIGQGSRIEIGENATLNIGDNFIISGQGKIICNTKIEIGDDSMFAWDSLVMDTDHHHIYNESGTIINPDSSIKIGKHVWLGTRTTILKGSEIANGCIIAANSLVCKQHLIKNQIIAGNPAVTIKDDVSW